MAANIWQTSPGCLRSVPLHVCSVACPALLCPDLQTKRLGAVSFGPNGDLFWLELRPLEKGRQVLVRK